ncbi:hypothetical protein Rhopal_001845-T1 [Rhodotorula paludigena]|uniref:Uncharacterized protein n=1 Tax=Rhodotorula paludigena TaxID=86838 RepID=A0AAV5GG75_9BASI|nr:hypothetical protein Rhopal_001845-T1 [Rhodotorula paludigena]
MALGLRREALKDLQPEARKAFAAEVSSPHGMAATVYKGAETNTGGDRSRLILSPSGISRYARLTSGSNAQPAIHEYSFLLASDAADILADTGGNSTYYTSFRLVDVEHKSFSLCYTFPDGSFIEHPVDARFFTDMNWDNLVKLAIGK